MSTSLASAAARSVAVVACALLLYPRAAHAQASPDPDEVPQVTRTFALVNARVVQAPGRVLDRATVVVRDGLIRAVGPDVAIPFDAERIAADSLTVYAGFIDGLSHAGMPKPQEDRDRERPDDPGNPPNVEAGIQPDRAASALLDPSGASIEQLRAAGFTIAHTVPYGQMLPGTGAIILLAEGDANALVLKDHASVFAQFEPARGMYPATDMAIMAKMRHLYREAKRRQRLETLYAQNSEGLERPAFDPVHYAFFPVLNGERPVFFHTESALDLFRVLDLQKTLGFPLVLTGLAESFVAVDALTQAGVPLLLTLDLPEEKKQTPADPDSILVVPPADTVHAMTPDAPGSFFMSDQRTLSYEDLTAETESLEARQAFEQTRYYKTAGWLHEAGLRFGFTTLDLTKPGEALANIRTMVANGLPEEAALAALTTNPAEILGIAGSAGTVEPGKMGNLVVTTGSLFDETTQIRYVFVDGRKFEIEATAEPADSTDQAVNPAGAWSYSIATPQGDMGGTITLTGSPGHLSGTISNNASDSAPASLEDLDLDGNALSFSFDGGSYGRLDMTLTITGDDLEGTIDVPGYGHMPVTGYRMSKPEF